MIPLAKSLNVITLVTKVTKRLGAGAMVNLKVRKFGNSLEVLLPKEIINRLHTGGARLFLIEGPDGSYRLTP